MVPNVDSAAAQVRTCFELPCTLRGNSPPRRMMDTCTAGANTIDLLLDVVVSAGEVLRSGTAVGDAVSSSWPRDRTGGATDVPAVVAADIAAAAAAIGAAVVVAAVAIQDASVADGPVAGCNFDHRRGGLAHGLHLQPRFGRRPHGRWLARGLRHSSSVDPTGSSPPEHFLFPGLSDQV